MMNILTHNFMQKCKSANFKTLKYVDFCAVFHRSIFGVSSGYLRDKTKVNFMYQRNDHLGGTFRVQRYGKNLIYANKNQQKHRK